MLAVRREHPMKASQMNSWFGYQGDQSGDKMQRFEQHVGGAIIVRCFELVAHFAMAAQ